jgi:hypothetical protein
VLCELNIGDDRYLALSDDVTTLQGVWDLPMIGSEKLDIEHEYQRLTGGSNVTLQCMEGAFVEGRDGQICQLQGISDYDELGKQIKLLFNQNEMWERFCKWKMSRPEKNNYYPAGKLPEDAMIVVRTEALREFERHSNDAPLPTSRAHVSDKLAKMNQAAQRFWSNADRDDRGTHPDNAKVAAWFVEQGFSVTLADKAATIIRPEWASTGRKPEEG